MESDHADHLTGRLVECDKGHRARIVELDQARDELVSELLHRREETQTKVVRRDMTQECVDGRLVLWTQGPREDPPTLLELEVALPLRRIGPNSEVRGAGAGKLPLRWPDRDASVDRGHAGFIRQQRIDVEFA